MDAGNTGNIPGHFHDNPSPEACIEMLREWLPWQ